MAIVDELHVVTDHTFEALAAVMAVHRAAELAGDASPASTSRRTAALGGARTDRLWARPNRYSGPGTMSQRPPPKAAASRVPPQSADRTTMGGYCGKRPPGGCAAPGGRTPTGLGYGATRSTGPMGYQGRPREGRPPGPPTY
jgi:hypothetical protein